MNVSDIYTLGVKIQGDTSSLRSELSAARVQADEFAKTVTDSLTRAATAIERSAAAMESSAGRTAKASQTQTQATRKAADGFDEYMKRATKAQEEVARSSEDTSRRSSTALGGLGGTLGRLAGAAGLGMLAKQVWDVGIGFHEFTQNAEVSLEVLLQSKDAVKGFLAEVMDFAKQTPYAFTDLTDQAKRLLTYGIDAQQVIPILEAVGDAATGMGTGVVGIERITRALGQINTKGRLQSSELLQLSEAGVNGLSILANQAGVTTREYQGLIEKGLIPADVAIAGLTQGIAEGTDGVNGQTAAFGGLMERIKGAGGITATVDSAKTSFRNAAAAVTESLVPAYVSFLQVGGNVLGVVKNTAGVFNALPGPVQNAALAFGAAAIAVKLLNIEGRAKGVWVGFQTTMAANRAMVDAMGGSVGRTRVAMSLLATGARATGTALMGAFGGPVGLAIAGVTAAFAAFSAGNAEAEAKANSLADTLDRVTGALTTQSAEWLQAELTKKSYFGLLNDATPIEVAERMGISVETLTAAWMGQADAIEEVRLKSDEYVKSQSFAESLTGKRAEEEKYLNRYMGHQIDRLKDAKAITEAKRKVDEAANDEVEATATGYRDASAAMAEFSKEQVDAMTKAEESAARMAGLNIGGLNLNLAGDEDVTAALDAVIEATRRLRDAEDARDSKAGNAKLSAEDRVRAEEAVTDARKALQDATDKLGQTEERTDPVKQYKDKINGILEATETFVGDIQKLADGGLNAVDLQAIIQAGPEGSADVRKALLGDPSTIDFTNEARTLIDGYSAEVGRQASLTQTAIDDAGGALGADLGLAMRLSAKEGTSDTVQELAESLETHAGKMLRVGNLFGLEFLKGLSGGIGGGVDVKVPIAGGGHGGQVAGYAYGGVFPGYTPGRDIGYIGVSGGEAIMRPEWTRAVGVGTVDRWNAIARTSGAAGVREEMRRYLGGFRDGGTVPQVVTVPVSSTIEHHDPMTVGQVIIQDAAGFEEWRRRGRRDAWGGWRP